MQGRAWAMRQIATGPSWFSVARRISPGRQHAPRNASDTPRVYLACVDAGSATGGETDGKQANPEQVEGVRYFRFLWSPRRLMRAPRHKSTTLK